MSRYVTRARVAELATIMGPRDYAVIEEIAALRFVSGSQLARLCFAEDDDPTPNVRSARRALRRLTRLEVIERLPRLIGGNKGGSDSFVYRLDMAGQRLAAMRGWLPGRRPRRMVPGQLFVRHALDVAELHARLVEGARLGRFELLKRASEPGCWRKASGVILKPDSYVRLGLGEFEDSYFIEVDRATEGSRAIQRQLDCYLAYHRSGQEQSERGVFPKVLWLTDEPDRASVLTELVSRLQKPDHELFEVSHFDQAVKVMSGDNTL